MKRLFAELRGAVMATLVLAIVCCGIYPLVVFGISQALFRDKANGSLITDKAGMIRGSRLLSQQFTLEKYFHSRPSAAGNGYDATSSGGSNLGPTSQKLNDTIKDGIAAYRAENGLKETDPVPADAVTTSGSGLDPHISLRNAELQVPRVAKARGLSAEKILELVHANTDSADLGILGEPGVNVLKLNLTLENLPGGTLATK
jgi:potassium-transporting ATPase KdpC subunit